MTCEYQDICDGDSIAYFGLVLQNLLINNTLSEAALLNVKETLLLLNSNAAESLSTIEKEITAMHDSLLQFRNQRPMRQAKMSPRGARRSSVAFATHLM